MIYTFQIFYSDEEEKVEPEKREKKKKDGQAIYVFSKSSSRNLSTGKKIPRVSAKGSNCRLQSRRQLKAEFFPFI